MTSTPIDQIVIGDIILIDAGYKIPCDGLLLKSDPLRVNESTLTGEPTDVENSLDLKSGDPFLLSGCIATAGRAEFLAIVIGKDSQ